MTRRPMKARSVRCPDALRDAAQEKADERGEVLREASRAALEKYVKPDSRPPCEICDFIGPELPGDDGRELHRAAADLGWAIVEATRLDRFVEWLTARLPKARP